MQGGWGHKQVLSGLKSTNTSKRLPVTATHCQTSSLSVAYNKSELSSGGDESVWGFIMPFSHLGGCKAIDTCYNSPINTRKNAKSNITIGVSIT